AKTLRVGERIDGLPRPLVELKLAHRVAISPVVALKPIDWFTANIELEAAVVYLAAFADRGSRRVPVLRDELVLPAAVILNRCRRRTGLRLFGNQVGTHAPERLAYDQVDLGVGVDALTGLGVFPV